LYPLPRSADAGGDRQGDAGEGVEKGVDNDLIPLIRLVTPFVGGGQVYASGYTRQPVPGAPVSGPGRGKTSSSGSTCPAVHGLSPAWLALPCLIGNAHQACDVLLVVDESAEVPAVPATNEHDERLARLPTLRRPDVDRIAADRTRNLFHRRTPYYLFSLANTLSIFNYTFITTKIKVVDFFYF